MNLLRKIKNCTVPPCHAHTWMCFYSNKFAEGMHVELMRKIRLCIQAKSMYDDDDKPFFYNRKISNLTN